MTTDVDTLWRVHAALDSQRTRVTFSPTPLHDVSLYCNDKFVGGIYDDVLCLVYTTSVSALLDHPEPVFRGASASARHKMLEISLERATDALELTWQERHAAATVLWDVEAHLRAERRNPEHVTRAYDASMLFLSFCFEHGFLNHRPTDHEGRLVQFRIHGSDLTDSGREHFAGLLDRYLAFLDRGGKSDPRRMLSKWLSQSADPAASIAR